MSLPVTTEGVPQTYTRPFTAACSAAIGRAGRWPGAMTMGEVAR